MNNLVKKALLHEMLEGNPKIVRQLQGREGFYHWQIRNLGL